MLKLELVPSKQLADETAKAGQAADRVHAGAHVLADGMGKLGIGLVVLGFGIVLAALVRGSSERGTSGNV